MAGRGSPDRRADHDEAPCSRAWSSDCITASSPCKLSLQLLLALALLWSGALLHCLPAESNSPTLTAGVCAREEQWLRPLCCSRTAWTMCSWQAQLCRAPTRLVLQAVATSAPYPKLWPRQTRVLRRCPPLPGARFGRRNQHAALCIVPLS